MTQRARRDWRGVWLGLFVFVVLPIILYWVLKSGLG